MQQTLAWIGMGSNLGDRMVFLQEAVNKLQQDPRLHFVNSSAIYESEPLGFEAEEQFLNAVIGISWTGSAEALLDLLMQVERESGRERKPGIRYQSRPLDLDILFFGEEVINNSSLQIPHPRLHERQFVLKPLNELIPSHIHPILQLQVSELVLFCTDKSKVFIHAKPLSINQ